MPVSAGLLLALQGLPVAAGNAAAVSAASLPHRAAGYGPAPVAARHQGGLYRISGHGRVVYLFGTVHVGAASFYPLAPEVSRALGAANRVVVELDTRANDAFARAVSEHGSYQRGDNIRRHLSAPILGRLTDALHVRGISLASMARLKPWLVANLLLSMELEGHGYRRSDGVEQALLAAAQRRGAPIAELESADYQLALFDTMNDIQAENYLRETLRDLADGSALRRARAVIDAWDSGDAHALDALLQQATEGRSAIADFTRRTLLGRRNPEMAAHIERLMREGSVTFVGVGLLHLLGANGLPQLLGQRGYLVERVY
ncbi:MAG: TraB/GumN family protein [Massilia sp.]